MSEQINIFSLDDDTTFQGLLKTRLESFIADMRFETCHTLADAKQYFKNNSLSFQVIFLDEHLPDGRGVDLLKENMFRNQAVISMSSDPNPQLPSSAYKAGAMYFLSKTQLRDALFEPLVQGVIDRNKIQEKLIKAERERAVTDTVKKLVSTLKHEINNPLGAVIGGAYLLKTADNVTDKQRESAELVETSAKRINHVLHELCEAVELETLEKAQEEVFHIPGDKEWK